MNSINSINKNNISFQSRIVFLSPKGFNKKYYEYKNKDIVNIFYYTITNNEKDLYGCYKADIKRGYTQGVKTCTAGVCVNKGFNAPLFWHVENTLRNIENFPILNKLIKGTNAIIIGSKKNYKYSSEVFEKFAEQMKLKNIPATLIKGTKEAEVEMLYDAPKDTLYTCMQHIFKRDNYVRSMEDLKECCDEVKISPKDSIEFFDFLPEPTLTQKIKQFFI